MYRDWLFYILFEINLGRVMRWTKRIGRCQEISVIGKNTCSQQGVGGAPTVSLAVPYGRHYLTSMSKLQHVYFDKWYEDTWNKIPVFYSLSYTSALERVIEHAIMKTYCCKNRVTSSMNENVCTNWKHFTMV